MQKFVLFFLLIFFSQKCFCRSLFKQPYPLPTWMIFVDEILGRYPLQLKQEETLYQDKTKQTFEDNIFVGFSHAMLNHILFTDWLKVAQI